MKSEEEKTLYKRFDENKINRIELMEHLDLAGSILMVSDLDIEEKDVYLMYRDCRKSTKIEILTEIYLSKSLCSTTLKFLVMLKFLKISTFPTLSYKKRDGVEKLYDTYKNTLDADILYLQDDDSVFGHMFVSFLSLYGYCTLENVLRKADLIEKYSPLDLLEYYCKVYKMDYDGQEIISEVPKKVRDLDKVLGLNLFPK